MLGEFFSNLPGNSLDNMVSFSNRGTVPYSGLHCGQKGREAAFSGLVQNDKLPLRKN